MQIEPITLNDLKNLGHLQPEGWSDILPDLYILCNLGFLQSD